MGNPIELTVGGTPDAATYTSSSNKVAANGDITINPGVTSITFSKSATWTFISPYISFDDDGPFTIGTTGPTQVEISDNDPGGGQDRNVEYTLHTSAGTIDPKIINKGGA